MAENIKSRSYTGTAEKDEIVWENVNGKLMYDSAGNPMDASRKERWLGRAEGQEEVREIHFRPSFNDPEIQKRRRQERVGEAARDTVTEQFDSQSVGFCYEIQPANHGVEQPEGIEPANHFDSQTTAKITMYGESKDVNEPGVDLETLDEQFQRQFRQAGRDPWIEQRKEMSEEHKQEKGYSKQYTRSPTWIIAPLFLLQIDIVSLLSGFIDVVKSLLNVTVWAVILGALAYVLGRRYFSRLVPSLDTLHQQAYLPRRVRLLLPTQAVEEPRRLTGLAIFVMGIILLATGSEIAGMLFLAGLLGYLLVMEIKSWMAKRVWMEIVEDEAYPIEFRIEEVSEEFDGQVLSDVLALDPEGSIGVIGAARSGKTQAMYVIAYQMVQESKRLDDHLKATFVAYDRKDDWKTFLPEDETIRLAGEDPTHIWNLFREVETETEFDVMARLMFPKAHESAGNDFFPKAARQLFSAACKYLWREFEEQGAGRPSNADLVKFFRRSREEMHEALSEYDDLTAATAALDPDAEGQAAGVFASVQQEIADSFVAAFGESPDEAGKPAFSFREYNEQPADRFVILDHQQRLGDSIDNIFRYFIDRSTRLGLDSESRMSYFILDEFAQVPHLRNIEELVSVGPGKNVNAIVALQSKTQLTHNYGSEQANSILAGLLTQIILRLNDDESIDHAKSITGVRHVSSGSTDSFRPFEEVNDEPMREQNDFAGGEFLSFSDGECVVKRKDGWAHGYMPMLQQQKWKIDAAHGWDKPATPDKAVKQSSSAPQQVTSEVSSDD